MTEQATATATQESKIARSQELRKRAGDNLTIEQLKRWQKHFGGRPVSYWRSAECEAALADPDCTSHEAATEPSAPAPEPVAQRNNGTNGTNGTHADGADLERVLRDFVQAAAKGVAQQIDEQQVEKISAKIVNDAIIGHNAELAAYVENRVNGEVKALKAMIEKIPPREFVVKVNDLASVVVEGRAHKKFEAVLRLASFRDQDGYRPNILLVGPAGCGKSMLGRQLAKALSLPFGFINLSEGVSESHLTGRFVPMGEGGRFEYVESQFAKFYRTGGVFVLDEIDAADPNVLMSINNALANGHMATANPAEPFIDRHEDFVCLACANTWGHGADRQYVGRNQLDVATLDRFACATEELDYDEDMERELAVNGPWVQWCQEVRAKLRELKLRRIMSTRFVLGMARQIAAKVRTIPQAKAQYFLGWTEDERVKLGPLARG